MDFATRVLVEGSSLDQAMPYMLAATSMSTFVRHTNLLHGHIFLDTDQPVICSEYIWTHPELRPFGRHLPANCPSCSCLKSFGHPIKLMPKGNTTYIFSCTGYNMDAKVCGHELSLQPMEDFSPYGKPQNGARWMVKVSTVVI